MPVADLFRGIAKTTAENSYLSQVPQRLPALRFLGSVKWSYQKLVIDIDIRFMFR